MFESASSQHEEAVVRLHNAWDAYPPEPDLAAVLQDTAADDAKLIEQLLSVDMEARGKRGLPATLEHYQKVLADQVRPGANLTRAILERELLSRDMSFGPSIDEQLRREYDPAYWTDLEAVTRRCWRRLKSAVAGEGSSMSKLLETPSADATDDTTAPAELHLHTVDGPTKVACALTPPARVTLGRHPDNTIHLTNEPRISRYHAEFICTGTGDSIAWFVVDLDSRHGTILNGVQLVANKLYPIEIGDLIQFTPWTLEVVDAATRELDSSFVNTLDDRSGESTVTRIGSSVPAPAAQDRLSVLLEVAESIHRAADKQALAEAVLTAAVTGTGFTNAAWLGPLSDDGRIQVAASRGAVDHESATPQLSRTLIRQAAKTGEPVSIARDSDQLVSAVSIAQLGIDDAICVPIKLDAAVSGFLYLDRRGTDMTLVGQTGQTGQSNEFACALGRLAAAALQNIKRHELEQRTKLMESDLNSAAQVQRWILPNRNGTVGPFHYVGECRPGRTISGDFFDVIPFANGRVAVTLGDATGKGAGASMLITTGQGFLHAALQANGQLDQAVNSLNQYLLDHCEGNRFVTLWAAVIDPEAQQLSYVDAGHSFAVLISGDGQITQLDAGGGLPLRVGDFAYETVTVPFGPADRIVVVSDGLIEQMGRSDSESEMDQYGIEGVIDALSKAAPDADLISHLFDAIVAYAGTDMLADDATALAVQWVQ